MQNEDWYAIITLILNILTAIGTVGAVGISLYYSYKAQKRENRFLELNDSVDLYFGKKSLSVYISLNNYIAKDIDCHTILVYTPSVIPFHIEQGIVPSYVRKHLISGEVPHTVMTAKSLRKDLLLITKAKKIQLRLLTDCGNFDFIINKSQIKQIG
jgi:hypothetical protein